MNSAMRLLGYAGLIPFIVLALFPGWIAPYLSQPPAPLFLTYSVIILGCMAGGVMAGIVQRRAFVIAGAGS